MRPANEASERKAATMTITKEEILEALKEGRVIDADFYKKNILIMYPDWKFKGEESRSGD